MNEPSPVAYGLNVAMQAPCPIAIHAMPVVLGGGMITLTVTLTLRSAHIMAKRSKVSGSWSKTKRK